jgi:hypothetical protein
MEIDPATGLIYGWTPAADQVGDHSVTISVTDSDPTDEGVAQQPFTLRVLSEPGNQFPQIVSQAITQVLDNTQYRYQVVAVDPDQEDQP